MLCAFEQSRQWAICYALLRLDEKKFVDSSCPLVVVREIPITCTQFTTLIKLQLVSTLGERFDGVLKLVSFLELSRKYDL